MQLENVAYVNLDDNPPRMQEQFEPGYNIPHIVSATQFETGGSYPKEAPSSSSTRFRHAEDIDGRMAAIG
ncbi:5-enolpyruvylshikimate-3-phosphate synthase [Eggerthella sp. YY7918]|nr:5-enolpyruvylshikimate-3-phosphate synthase [Eggerthella sp. YY7918]